MSLAGNIVTFGESLLRLAPPDHLRLQQATSLELVYGGAEANVAISLANFGLPVQYVTRLPDNELGKACLQQIRKYGVGTEFVEIGGERLGIYFLEVGSGKRPSRVLYDREHSSFATIEEDPERWRRALGGASWFHWSGISPAVSAGAARATAGAVAAAREAGLIVSCDLNYRHTLWKWGASSAEIMPDMVQQCDVLAANGASVMLGLPGLPQGKTPEEAVEACAQLAVHYPGVKQVAMTCKEEMSSREQRLTAVLWQAGQSYTSASFPLRNVVDRVGGGDAFMAGLIYGLVTFPDEPQRTVDFAAACAAMKVTIAGDANLASVGEIEQLLAADAGFDIVR